MSAVREDEHDMYRGEDGYYHFLYRITNKRNGKFYVGIHSTHDLDDGYMGSGTNISQAVKKYGKDSFVREILEFFENRQELSEREKEIVDEDFINRPDTYNIVLGGDSGLGDTRRTSVLLLDLEGNLLREFSSGTEAEKHFGQSISHYLNKNKIFREKFFLVSDSRTSETTKKKMSEKKKTPVKLLDLEGNLLREFSSRTEVEKHFEQDIDRYLNKNKIFREKFFLVSDSKIKFSETTKKKLSEKNRIPVKLLDLEGNLLREFPSKKEAEEQFGQQIDHYLNKNRVFREKFFLVSDSKIKLSETTKKKISEKNRIPVKLLDLEGNLLREFSSRTETEDHFGQRIRYYLNKNRVFRDKFFLVSDSKISETAKKKMSEKKKIQVKLLDLEGNLLREFSSRNEAENYFGQHIGYYLNKNRVFKDKFFLVSENKVSRQKEAS